MNLRSFFVFTAMAVVTLTGFTGHALAEQAAPPPLLDPSEELLGATERALVENPWAKLDSLKRYPVQLPDLNGIVLNRPLAIMLGKALFWDQAAGSDGVACATCHFAAGADSRTVNQLNPGGDLRFPGGDKAFGALTQAPGAKSEELSPANTAGQTAGGSVAAPNMALSPADFPLHRLADPNDRSSEVLYTTNDVVGSGGGFGGAIMSAPAGSTTDKCAPGSASVFHVGGQPTRAVAGRNAPTVINAVYFRRTFWDGRANGTFNGVDPFGARNADAFVAEAVGMTGVAPRKLALKNATLASQAVGPPLSDVESSCAGRVFPQLARRLGSVRPLASQAVHAQDGVLGTYRHTSGKGLSTTYSQIIQKAFDSRWWRVPGKYNRVNGRLVADANGFTQQELNFSMFWGIAVMLYESTLRSDDSPFDRAAEGVSALSEQEMRGMRLFNTKAGCLSCHRGPVMSTASYAVMREPISHEVYEVPEGSAVQRMPGVHVTTRPVLYDEGYYNIGVTPTVQDIGLGGTDPWKNPLSFTKQFVNPASKKDTFDIQPCWFEVRFNAEQAPEECVASKELAVADLKNQRLGVDGAFKVPTLRNVGLTAPYFHNGGYATLRSVIQFYARGGNRRGKAGDDVDFQFDDNSGTGAFGRDDPAAAAGTGSNVLGVENITGPDPLDRPPPGRQPEEVRGLSDGEIDDLVAFMLTFTDQRVQCSAAPFDHPAISLPEGHLTTRGVVTNAKDFYTILSATGAEGLPLEQCLVNSGDLFVR